MGLPLYLVKVRPLSVLYAKLWHCPINSAEVYIAMTASLPKPAVLFASTTAEPEKIVPSTSGSIAIGSWVQWIRSLLDECAQVMFCHIEQ